MEIKKWILCLSFFLMTGCTEIKKVPEPQDNQKYKLIISVQDLTAPKIHLLKEKIEIMEGEEVELSNYVKISDNMDHNLKPEIIGEYDTEKAGTYELTVAAEDTSGNKTSKKLLLIVKGEEKKPEIDTPLPDTIPSAPSIPFVPSDSVQPTIPSIPNNLPPVPSPSQFLFEAGYTRTSAYDACMASGKNGMDSTQASSFTCSGIYDDNNRALGYLLTFE